ERSPRGCVRSADIRRSLGRPSGRSSRAAGRRSSRAGLGERSAHRPRRHASRTLGRARLSIGRLDPATIAAKLGPDGSIARALSGYEHRRDQVRMAERVAETFTHGGILVIEAGTGTGKSLAYLVPAVHWSREHAERVIVSTNTINLQEQLIRIDLP